MKKIICLIKGHNWDSLALSVAELAMAAATGKMMDSNKCSRCGKKKLI